MKFTKIFSVINGKVIHCIATYNIGYYYCIIKTTLSSIDWVKALIKFAIATGIYNFLGYGNVTKISFSMTKRCNTVAILIQTNLQPMVLSALLNECKRDDLETRSDQVRHTQESAVVVQSVDAALQ